MPDITGKINRAGICTLTWNVQLWKLEAPNKDGKKRHYLPCSDCGIVQSVEWNVVAITCLSCWDNAQ